MDTEIHFSRILTRGESRLRVETLFAGNRMDGDTTGTDDLRHVAGSEDCVGEKGFSKA